MLNQERKTHTIDATGKAPGRLATEIAGLLRGKGKADFAPNIDIGDSVVVENVNDMKITGTKMENKKYYRHSTHPGGLKTTTMKELVEKKGMEEVLRKAVYGMIPGNRLRKGFMKRLTIK